MIAILTMVSDIYIYINVPNNLMETNHKNAKRIITRERKNSNKSPKCPLQNMKLTGDIIRVVNTLRFSKGVN